MSEPLDISSEFGSSDNIATDLVRMWVDHHLAETEEVEECTYQVVLPRGMQEHKQDMLTCCRELNRIFGEMERIMKKWEGRKEHQEFNDFSEAYRAFYMHGERWWGKYVPSEHVIL